MVLIAAWETIYIPPTPEKPCWLHKEYLQDLTTLSIRKLSVPDPQLLEGTGLSTVMPHEFESVKF